MLAQRASQVVERLSREVGLEVPGGGGREREREKIPKLPLKHGLWGSGTVETGRQNQSMGEERRV